MKASDTVSLLLKALCGEAAIYPKSENAGTVTEQSRHLAFCSNYDCICRFRIGMLRISRKIERLHRIFCEEELVDN